MAGITINFTNQELITISNKLHIEDETILREKIKEVIINYVNNL